MKQIPLACARVLLVSMLVPLVSIMGCGDNAREFASAPAEGVILAGNAAEPESLDPHLVQSVYAARIASQLFEGLVVLDPKDLSPQPGVAESWESSDDGMRYTFHLRENAVWSNGDPITAQDFVYSWRRILTPTLASQYAYMLYPLENAEAYNTGKITDFNQVGVKALDEHTLEVKLNAPTPYFMTLHAHQTWFPVHQATVEAHGAMDERNTRWTRPENFVGNGPYVLTDWSPNQVLSLRPNKRYWNASAIANDGVDFLPVTSEQTEERMFSAGEMHMTERVPLQRVEWYRNNRPEVLRIDPANNIAYAFANCNREPFDDARVRRAFSMTLDRELISSRIRQGVDPPAYFFTPPGMNGYVSPARIEEDREEARRLMAEAGYPEGEGFPRVELLYSTSDAGKYLTEAMQQMWQEALGVRVEILNQEWKVFLDTTAQGNYSLALMAWAGDVLDPMNFLELFESDNGNNRSGYANSKYDELISAARQSNDVARRNELFGQAETILLDDSPIIPVYFKAKPFLCVTSIQNFPSNLLDYRRYHLMHFGESGGD